MTLQKTHDIEKKTDDIHGMVKTLKLALKHGRTAQGMKRLRDQEPAAPDLAIA